MCIYCTKIHLPSDIVYQLPLNSFHNRLLLDANSPFLNGYRRMPVGSGWGCAAWRGWGCQMKPEVKPELAHWSRTGRAQVGCPQSRAGGLSESSVHACLYACPSITHFSTHELPSPISFFFARRITPIWRPKVIKKVTKMVTQTMCMTFPCGEQNHTHGPGWPKVPRRQGQGPPRSPK